LSPIVEGFTRLQPLSQSHQISVKAPLHIPSLRPGRLWAFLLALLVAGPSLQAGYWWRDVPVFGGGDVTGVVYNQSNGDLYLRTNVGGAFRWNPITGEWIPLLDYIGQSRPNEEYLAYVLSLATDPTNPQRLYVAVGGYLNYTGNGAVLISANRGATWSESDLPFPVGGNDNGSPTGERLQVDPNLPSTLYLASQNNGLWHSQDAGVTWSQMTGLTQNDLNFIRPDPSSSPPGTACQRLFIGANNTTNNIWLSADGGNTWSAVTGQPNVYYPMRCALAGNLLYVSYCNSDTTAPGNATAGSVWRYNISGASWSNLSPPNGVYGFGGLCVDPQHPTTLMAGTMDDYSPGNLIYRSVNGGSTWKDVLRKGIIDGSEAPYTEANFTYQNWIEDIEINPLNSNEAIFVTGYGIYMTENLTQADAGQKATWTFPDRGLEETVVLGLASPPSGPFLLTALADVAGFRYDNFNTSPPNGDGEYAPFFPTSSSIDFAELKPNFAARSHTRNYVNDSGPRGSYSADGGQSWVRFPTEPAGAADSGVLAVAADASTIVWTPAGEGPYYSTATGAGTYYSTNFGVTWTASAGLTDDLQPVSDRVNPKKFYAYDTVNGIVYASVDGGVMFATASTGLPTLPSYNVYGSLLKAVFGQEGNLWLAGGAGGLWRSVNSGATFTQVTTVQSALQVGFGEAAPSQAYPVVFIVGTVGGVYGFFQSDDQGNTWTRINDDSHQFGAIYCLTGDERMYGRVYVGTGGRGTVYADPVSPAPGQLQIHPGSGPVNLQYPTEPGWDYILMQEPGLGSNAAWTGAVTNAGTGGLLNYTNLPSGSGQFFRMRIQTPQ
jgi:photosystem II stability/assembly factor-like uncharacterized protein